MESYEEREKIVEVWLLGCIVDTGAYDKVCGLGGDVEKLSIPKQRSQRDLK